MDKDLKAAALRALIAQVKNTLMWFLLFAGIVVVVNIYKALT